MQLTGLINIFVKFPFFLIKNIPKSSILEFHHLFSSLDKFAEEVRFSELNARSQLRDINLSELFGEKIELVETPYGTINEDTGKQNQAELLIVNTIARFKKSRNIFEFGTFTGRSTYYFTFISPDTHVYTLDLPPGKGRTIPEVGTYFIGSDREDRITQILTDSQKFDPTPYKKSMDFIFIDGDHSYAGVKNDTEKAFEMLKPGGTILWHDYGPSRDLGLVQFFVEFTKNQPLFRIKKTSLLLYLDGIDPLRFSLDKNNSLKMQGGVDG